MSASHAEGRGFEPRPEYFFFIFWSLPKFTFYNGLPCPNLILLLLPLLPHLCFFCLQRPPPHVRAQSIIGQMTPSSARYDVQSSLFGRAVDAPNDTNKAETPANGKGDGKTAAAVDDGGEKRGQKRAAAPRKEGAGGDDDEGSSEEGSADDSEEDSGQGDSEYDSEGSGDEGEEEEEEEEEEEIDQGHYHALCKKPEHEPLKEPRFGLCFWSDAVPVEVRRVGV